MGSNNIPKINKKKMNINTSEHAVYLFWNLEEFAAFIQPNLMLHRVQFRSLSAALDEHLSIFRLKEKKNPMAFVYYFVILVAMQCRKHRTRTYSMPISRRQHNKKRRERKRKSGCTLA